jgi:hypothetical protein
MLNEQTRKGLKTVSSLGNAAIIRYPYATVLQKNKTLIAFVDLREYGEEEFEEFGLDETLSEFLNLVDFYDDPEIENDGTLITIKSGNRTQHYNTSDVSATMKSYDIKSEALDKIDATPEVLSFFIPKEEIQRIKKISSLTRADSLIVKDGQLITGKLDRNGNISNDSVTNFPVTASKDVSAVFDMGNIGKLPDKDYRVSIKQSEKTGNGISLWEMEDEPIKIIVSVQDMM